MKILCCVALVYNWFFFFRTAVLWKLLDIRFSFKHCNFSRGCLLIKMISKTVIRPIKSYWFCSYRYSTAISQWRQPHADRLWTRRGKRRHYHSWGLQIASTNESPGYKRIFWQRWKAFGGMPQYYVGKVISVLPLGGGVGVLQTPFLLRGSWRGVPNPSSQPKFGPNPSSQANFCQNPSYQIFGVYNSVICIDALDF